jgi:hypothetical protein
MTNSLRSIGYAIVVASSVAITMPAQAANFVYYKDDVIGTDQFLTALAASGNTYTVATSATNFLTLLQTNTYDVGAFFVQDQSASSYSTAINGLGSFVAGGGKAIYADWSLDSSLAAQFGVGFTGNTNNTAVTILDPAFGTNQTLTNTGWGTFSTGLTALSGNTVAATFGNGDGAIVVGNGGRSIVYGFLNDTTSSPVVFAGGISQLASGATDVPEPFTVIGSIIGGTAAFRMRKKLKSDNKV